MNRKQLLVFLHDVIASGLAIILAMSFRVGLPTAFEVYEAMENALLVSALSVLILPFFSLNRGSWRYASIRDLTAILKGSAVLILAFLAVRTAIDGGIRIPRSTYPLSLIMVIVCLSASRILFRLYKEYYAPSLAHWLKPSEQPEPVLIVGFTDRTELFIRSVRREKTRRYTIAGIVTTRRSDLKRHIHGVPVLGLIEDADAILAEVLRRGIRISRLVIGDRQLAGEQLDQLVSFASRNGIVIARLPEGFAEESQSGPIVLKPFSIEDLLGRPAANLMEDDVLARINGKRILVTGGGGSIGLELCRIIGGMGPARLVILDNTELNIQKAERDLRSRFGDLDLVTRYCDIRDRETVRRLFAHFRPEIVIHAAAMKHVEILQRNPNEGANTNFIGAVNVAEASEEYGAEAVVLISTDKAVGPTSVLGKTKRIAEIFYQEMDAAAASATRFLIVRFGNVLGTTGSVVPIFTEQIKAGGPITVTHPDVTRFFMAPVEAAQLVLRSIVYGLNRPDDRGQVLVLDMGKPVKIVDLAKTMIELAGRVPNRDIRIEFTGLKPGEKLHEELIDRNETGTLTEDGSVIVAAPDRLGGRPASRHVAALRHAIREGRDNDTVALMDTILASGLGQTEEPAKPAGVTLKLVRRDA